MFQAFFSICSERMLMEQINNNLLFRWAFDGFRCLTSGSFMHSRARLREADAACDFLSALMALAQG
ncbi:hypothetical protein [Ochrobactrum chromiisoli]|uniref:hypothetical protein n=1 Tax=Ochrobactrum chromiisoli TaxID=2993941 RepID=UPI00389932F5